MVTIKLFRSEISYTWTYLDIESKSKSKMGFICQIHSGYFHMG